jgi:hypothetical protein
METLSTIDPDDHEAIMQEAFRVHGQIVHHAALADCLLFEIFRHFSGCARPIAQAIFFTLDSAKAKETLTTRTARAAGAKQDTIDQVGKLTVAIQRVLDHRNAIAHAFLMIHDPIFDDPEIRLINPKTVHAKSKAVRVRTDEKSPPPRKDQVSATSLQKSLSESNLHLSKAMQEFRSLCRHIGIQPQLSLERGL